MITAVVHTYNEEEVVGRCLASLSWADERIVVDMGSTDKTRSIAKKHHAIVLDHPYTGFVEPARNFGIEHAQGDWVLILDADEELPQTLVAFLQRSASAHDADYFRIPRKTIIFDRWIKHTGWWPDYQIRFFKKDAVRWTPKLHGVPITKGTGQDIEADETLSIIHHHYTSVSQFIERLNRYSSISAKELFVNNQKFEPSFLFSKPAREFIQRYFAWQGHKDGVHGLALSLLQSFSELVVYLKLWELEKFSQQHVDVADVSEWTAQQHREMSHWILTTRMSKPHSVFSALRWKIQHMLSTW